MINILLRLYIVHWKRFHCLFYNNFQAIPKDHADLLPVFPAEISEQPAVRKDEKAFFGSDPLHPLHKKAKAGGMADRSCSLFAALLRPVICVQHKRSEGERIKAGRKKKKPDSKAFRPRIRSRFLKKVKKMAEWQGFEPWVTFRLHSLSKTAP